jgi:hypothetical protein
MRRNFDRKNTGIFATLAAMVAGILHNNQVAPQKAPHQGIGEKARRLRQIQSGFLTASNGLV